MNRRIPSTDARKMAELLGQLEARVNDLERASRITYSSIDDDGLSVTDADGNEVIRVGLQDDDTHAVQGPLRTPDYTPGSAGVTFEAEASQVPNLNVLDTLGAGKVSTNQIVLNGLDLESQIMPSRAVGLTAFAQCVSVDDSATLSSTAITVGVFNPGLLDTSRAYEMTYEMNTDAGVSDGDVYLGFCTYTTDGTEPDATSPVLASSKVWVHASAPAEPVTVSTTFFVSPTDTDMLIALNIARVTGVGTAKVVFGTEELAPWIALGDVGPATAFTTASLVQRNSDGGAPDEPPLTTYHKTWNPTWQGTYYNNNTRYKVEDGSSDPTAYQGWLSADHINMTTLFGFDYAAIQAELADAVEIVDVWFTFRMKSTKLSAGASVQLGTHDYTTRPNTSVDTSRLDKHLADTTGVTAGAGGTVFAGPGVTTIGDDFKAGTIKGLVISAPDSSDVYSCSLYGYANPGVFNPPALTIYYKK